MELMLEVISRVILVTYFFILLMLASQHIKFRLLPNSKYVIYCNYVNEKNRSQAESQMQYYEFIVKGMLIQLAGLLWASFIVHQLWFTIISMIAAICVLIESLSVNWIFPTRMERKEWILLYMKRIVGIIGDAYLVMTLIALCFIY